MGLVGVVVIPVLPRPRSGAGPAAAGLVAAVAVPLVLFLLGPSSGSDLLAQGRVEWVAYQLLVALLLTVVCGLLLATVRPGAVVRGALWASAGSAVLLAALAGALFVSRAEAVALVGVAWGVPVALAAYGVRSLAGWRRPVGAWAIAIVIASSAAVPTAWGHSIETRLAMGARALERIAQVEDPELEDRLFDFAHVADSLDAAGAEDVTILYEGWRRSGLSTLGHPVRLQMENRDGSPGEGLRIAVAEG